MKSLWWAGLFLWVCGASVVAAEKGPLGAGERLDTGREQIVRRTVVPSLEKPQGEVQLIRQGQLLVVRTLIASRVLKRVAAAIDTKEQRNWPESKPGHLASQHYREMLQRATKESWEIFQARPDPKERRQFLSIEFIYDGRQGLIALAVPQLAGDYGQLSITANAPLESWLSSADYVRNNMIAIVQDSFHLDEAATQDLLASLWPESDESKGVDR